jgi:hypothetical protein
MDLTNRILAIGTALILIFLIFVVILLAWGAPDQSIDRLADLAGFLDDHNSAGARLIVTFGGLIFVLLAAIVIIVEVSPPETGSVQVRSASGNARIGTDEVVQRLESELAGIAQVAGVQAKVFARGKKAEVNLDLYVTADADLGTTTAEACQRARSLLEGPMGVELDCEPRARIHYRELSVGRPASRAPAVTPASPRPPSPSTGASTWGTPSAPGTTPPAGPAFSPQPPASMEPSDEAAQAAHQDRPAAT